MKHNYIKVIATFFISFIGLYYSFAQTAGPEFLQCSIEPIPLCVQDEGVRLPSNNQIYLGEGHPDATSCSVHVTQKMRVKATCGSELQYEVQLFIHDTSAAYILKSLTSINTDSTGEAELTFNTEESPDDLIRLSGVPYTTGCHPYHRIKWIVLDSCGSEAICEQRIYLYDCLAPIVNHDSTETIILHLLAGGQLTVYAEDFIYNVLDDCTVKEDFLYSFNKHQYSPDSVNVCENIPVFAVPIPYDCWIADSGRDLNCNGTIEWSERNIERVEIIVDWRDNFGCPPPPDPTISGHIRNVNHIGIKLVLVTLKIQNQFYSNEVTLEDGLYKFHFNPGYDYTIVPERNDNHKNGVTTLDLVKIQKHLLGKELFTSPYQFLAADANNSQNVSAIDLIELRKLILGIYTELPQNPSWRFVPGSITFNDAMDIDSADFLGIKIGDVNNTAIPNFTQILTRQTLEPFRLVTNEQKIKAGEIIHVPIFLSMDQQVTGFQFTLSTSGLEIMDIIPGAIKLTEDDYGVLGDKVTMSWFDENKVNISSAEVLFTLKMRATALGNLSQMLNLNSEITEAEIYLENEKTFLPILLIGQPVAKEEMEIVSVYPNPWKQTTSIYFNLQHEGRATITLTDINGQEIFRYENLFSGGTNKFDLSSNDFETRGLIFYHIHANNKSASTRMVVLE